MAETHTKVVECYDSQVKDWVVQETHIESTAEEAGAAADQRKSEVARETGLPTRTRWQTN